MILKTVTVKSLQHKAYFCINISNSILIFVKQEEYKMKNMRYYKQTAS